MLRLVSDVFKELSQAHAEASERNDLDAIAEISTQLEGLLCDVPEDAGVLFAYATTKIQLGSFGVAVNLFYRVAEMRPDLPEVWNNLGSAWKGHNFDEKARECWEKALSLREDADYYNNFTSLYVNVGDPQGGMAYAKRGLELQPDHHRLHWNYSLVLLEQGFWKEGFKHYEHGLKSKDRPVRHFDNDPEKVPYWEGQRGTVVVYGEQGMGDEVMFASAMPDLLKRAGIRVIFECHPRLKKLFKRSFDVECHGTRKDKELKWVGKAKPDYKMAMGSLFKLFRSDGEFPKQPYLKPNATLVKKYRKRLEETGPGPYIGIGWLAGTVKTRSDYRSIKISEFKPIFEHGGTFVSMQYTEGAGDKCERFFNDTGIRVHHWEEIVEGGPREAHYPGYNYDHTVALAAALDLVIVPNTTLVHVCGAIGQECWTLTPKEAAWRYQLEGSEMPMYGKWVRQFRNGMAEVGEAYEEWISRWSGTDLPCSKTGTDPK